MKHKTLKLMAVYLLLLAGCATGTHIITGAQRPALKPDQVKLYQVAPDKFEVVGIVNSRSPGMRQHNMDDAVNVLKEEAAKIGANGILLGGINPGSESVGVASGSGFGGGHAAFGSAIAVGATGIQLSGEAIHVTP